MKKRILSIVLCLAMLLGTAVLFSSCKKEGDGEPVLSKKVKAVDLTDYSFVYAADLNTSTRQAAIEAANRIKDLTKIMMRPFEDEETSAVATEDLEILIGKTNRKETEKTLKSLKGNGWAIRVFKNKIVVVGTNDFLTRVALSYFVENYLSEGAIRNTTVSINEKVTVKKLGVLELVADGEGKFDFVYDNRVDGHDNGGPDGYAYDSDPNPTTGGPDVDYTYTVLDEIRKQLASTLGVRSSTMPNKLDNGPVDEYEILVGNMDDRPEYREQILKLAADEYGICIKNNKIMVLAWNDVTLASAHQLVKEMFQSCLVADDEGNITSEVPSACFVKMKLKTNWVLDFPKLEGNGIELNGTLDVGDNSLEYIYTGDGVTNAAYLAYCDKLEADGYELVGTESVWEESTFRTYFNEEKGSALHVYHSVYKYADLYSECKSVLPSIRVIASDDVTTQLPPEEILKSNQTYAVRTPSKITSLKLNTGAGSFGNSYIITLADGTFIIYDGGLGQGGFVDRDNTWEALKALHKEAFGKEPDSTNPIHVRAWILSHEHADHSTVFTQFLSAYGKNPAFRLDNFLFNGISDSERVNSNNPGNGIHGKHMTALQNKVTGGFNYVKMHTGQTYYFANMKMEVLYTHEDSYPKRLEYFNNSSTIFRTTFMDSGETMIWLGDSERIGGAHILGMFGPTLDSDMVQVAHHGWNGVTTNTYDVIAPEVVWWPTSRGNFNSWTKNPNAAKWFHRVDHDIAYNVASVELILVADIYNTTMTFTPNSNDYDTLYDLVGGQEIVYCELSTNINSTVIDKRPKAAS